MKKVLPFMAVLGVISLAVGSAEARGRRPDEDTTVDSDTSGSNATTTDTGVPTGTDTTTGTMGETYDRSGTTLPTDATSSGTTTGQ